MKHRDPQSPLNPRRWRQKLLRDPQVKAWAKRIVESGATVRPEQLSEEQLTLIFAEVLKRRHRQFNPDLFVKAMSDTAPIVAAPEIDDPIGDLREIWAQPEMVRLWKDWNGPRGSRGPAPNYPGSKALLANAAITGASAHMDDNLEELRRNDDLRTIYSNLEKTTNGKELSLGSYPQALALAPRLGLPGIEAALHANADMIRELKAMFPGQGILKRLTIDGCRVPAWARQKSSLNNEKLEAELRKRVPEAGFRAYSYSGNGKKRVGNDAGKALKSGKIKTWRGFYLVGIFDTALSGLPLVWTTIDASTDEAQALVLLMSALYRFFPELEQDPPELIVADSAWDEKAWCRLTEVFYGVPMIARHHDDKNPHRLGKGDSRDGSVRGYTNKGQLICAAHKKPLSFSSVTRPSRKGLRPGQSAPEGQFRLRATCPDGCGKLGLRMQVNWRRLTAFPHHPEGRPNLFAMRQAMLLRAKLADSAFNRVKTGRKMAIEGPARSRLLSKDTQEALLSLSLVSMTALTLADQRRERGQAPTLPSAPSGGAPSNPPTAPPLPASSPTPTAVPDAPASNTAVKERGAAQASGPRRRRTLHVSAGQRSSTAAGGVTVIRTSASGGVHLTRWRRPSKR